MNSDITSKEKKNCDAITTNVVHQDDESCDDNSNHIKIDRFPTLLPKMSPDKVEYYDSGYISMPDKVVLFSESRCKANGDGKYVSIKTYHNTNKLKVFKHDKAGEKSNSSMFDPTTLHEINHEEIEHPQIEQEIKLAKDQGNDYQKMICKSQSERLREGINASSSTCNFVMNKGVISKSTSYLTKDDLLHAKSQASSSKKTSSDRIACDLTILVNGNKYSNETVCNTSVNQYMFTEASADTFVSGGFVNSRPDSERSSMKYHQNVCTSISIGCDDSVDGGVNKNNQDSIPEHFLLAQRQSKIAFGLFLVTLATVVNLGLVLYFHPSSSVTRDNFSDLNFDSSSILNLEMVLKGISPGKIDENTVADWQLVTSSHIENFYKSVDMGISNVRVKTIANNELEDSKNNQDGSRTIQISYAQEFDFETIHHDKILTPFPLELAIDPFGTFRDGKENYIESLKKNGVFFITSHTTISILALTDTPTGTPTSTHIPSELPTYSQIPSNVPSVFSSASPSSSPTLSYNLGLIEIQKDEDPIFPTRNIAMSDDHLWSVKGNSHTNLAETLKWDESKKSFAIFQIFPGCGGTYYGSSISMTGDAKLLIVGADSTRYYTCSVRIFVRDNIDDLFVEKQRLEGGQGVQESYGYNVDILKGGEFLAVSAHQAHYYGEIHAGSIYIYTRDNFNLFQLVERFDGKYKLESLGERGVSINISQKSLVVSTSSSRRVDKNYRTFEVSWCGYFRIQSISCCMN